MLIRRLYSNARFCCRDFFPAQAAAAACHLRGAVVRNFVNNVFAGLAIVDSGPRNIVKFTGGSRNIKILSYCIVIFS